MCACVCAYVCGDDVVFVREFRKNAGQVPASYVGTGHQTENARVQEFVLAECHFRVQCRIDDRNFHSFDVFQSTTQCDEKFYSRSSVVQRVFCNKDNFLE